MSKQHTIITLVVAVIVGVAGFFGGIAYASRPAALAKSLQTMSAQQRQQLLAQMRPGNANVAGGAAGGFGNRPGGTGQRGGANGGFVTGQILSKDDKSITIKLADGGSRIVFYSATTQVSKPATIQVSDLAAGDNVSVMGSSNSDGSVTASTIQMRAAPPQQNQAPAGQTQPAQ